MRPRPRADGEPRASPRWGRSRHPQKLNSVRSGPPPERFRITTHSGGVRFAGESPNSKLGRIGRNFEQSKSTIREHGADQVFIDTGLIAEQVREVFPCGVNKVLELVGTTTLADSIAATRKHGVVCMTGMVGDSWSFEDFSPMATIPTAVHLTTYSGGSDDFMRTPLQELIELIENGVLRVKVGRTFRLDEIVEAHRCMESNQAGGKVVMIPSNEG